MSRADTLAVRVAELAPLSPTLLRLVLVSADGRSLPVSSAGAHLTLTLPCELGRRQNAYSIVSSCDDRAAYELVVRRTAESRGGSQFIHQALKVGQVLQASMPNSQFQLQSTARKHLLIGGGVGITPLLSLLRQIRARGGQVELRQFARASEAAVFEQLLEPLAGADVYVHAGRAAFDPTALLARQPLGTHLYCCGPQTLMDCVLGAAVACGWPSTSVHTESFAAAGGAPFLVRLARQGVEVAVGEHESMLEALENAGVAAPSLCRGGACGECLTAVLEGVPDHRDHVLSAAEKAAGRLVMPCVSRAKTPYLTLDL